MDKNTVIFNLLNENQKQMFKEFQEEWMKKFNFETMTFSQYFHYVRILAIENSVADKMIKHNFLHVSVMEMIKEICLNSEDFFFKKNIAIMDMILQEKYMHIEIQISVYIDPKKNFTHK